MFPTFISIIDIQSWWEVPSIAHFCSLFRTAFNLLDFDIEDLEEALLTDGTEESSWLQDLIVRLLSGCLPNNEISTFNYQMFLRRLFRQKCQEHDRYNPFNTDIDFQLLPLRTKVDILHALCDFRLDADDVFDQLKNLEADSLRVEPLGYDSNESAYWYFYGTRLYREDGQTKSNKKSVWQVICFTEDDWYQLTKKFKKSANKQERQLYQTLNENFLPELPRLFKEKENLARKRLLENLPRRTSTRLRKLEYEAEKVLIEKAQKVAEDEAKQQNQQEKLEENKKQDLEKRRKEVYERRSKLKEQSEEGSLSDRSIDRDEMAGYKSRKSKGRQRKMSSSSSTGKDVSKPTKKNKKHQKELETISKSSFNTTTVGRQTNNSLSAATGQILIQQPPNSNKKKLKTSLVFRQTDEDLQTGMHKILDYMKNHEDAWPFVDPVEEEYAPNYYSIIRKPMDLQRMEERLDSGYYKNFTKFRSDFQLIVDNCRLYNGVENEYTEMVDNLLRAFERATEKYLDMISSSDDEIAIEYSNTESEKNFKKSKSDEQSNPYSNSRRKPMLVAQTDKKRERSVSETSENSRNSCDFSELNTVSYKSEKVLKKTKKSVKSKNTKLMKKQKSNLKLEKTGKERKKDEHEIKKGKKEKSSNKKSTHSSKNKIKKSVKKGKKKSSVRSRSNSRSPYESPPRSDVSSSPMSCPPSSPDEKFHFNSQENSRKRSFQNLNDSEDSFKGKMSKLPKFGTDNDDFMFPSEEKTIEYPILSPKPKDKHNKLRETIEKLKAKSEIKIRDEFDFELDLPKENKDKNKKPDKELENKNILKAKEKYNTTPKSDIYLELDGNNTLDSIISESKNVKIISKNNTPAPKPSNLDALTIATEETLKDINKWLDDTPKFSEFSSTSNSPSYIGGEDLDTVPGKVDQTATKKVDKPSCTKKESGVKDLKKRSLRDTSKFFKKREVQRTIDRLQPGKSKGNLISNVQNSIKTDEMFSLGPLTKIKDTKNSLIVKTDTNAPKLSLGSVLDSFGKHNFIDDQKKEEQKILAEIPKENATLNFNDAGKQEIVEVINKEDKEDKKDTESPADETVSAGGATPNLSAWFKAFGAPKVQPIQKKNDIKPDGKENEKIEESSNKISKVPAPIVSPNIDNLVMTHGQPISRQRRISTGSSMSERSSFSQDMDSPRVGMDERGAYPAPYPSPLHRSPSGASPVMASPRPDISPKAASYPTISGQIRCGFYQDTVSNKSSPDKSCSPKETPQSPYPHYSEHVYTPNTENSYYSYANSPYYTHAPNYSSTNPTPPYSMEGSSSYYDTSKSISEQHLTKNAPNYTANSPASNQSSPAHPQHSPSLVLSPHSPNIHSPTVLSPHSPNVHSPNIHSPHSPNIHTPHSPNIHSSNIHSQHSPNVSQHSPSISQHSANVQFQHSPTFHSQQSPISQSSPEFRSRHSPALHLPHSPIHSPNLISNDSQNSSLQSQLSPTHNSPKLRIPDSPSIQSSPSPKIQTNLPELEILQKADQNDLSEKVFQQTGQQSAMFPVKKRVYNDNESSQMNTQNFESKTAHDPIMSESSQNLPNILEKNYKTHQDQSNSLLNLETRESLHSRSIGSPLSHCSPQTSTELMNNIYSSTKFSSTFTVPYTREANCHLNIPTTTVPSTQANTIEMSKYTNMGYTGAEVNYSKSGLQYSRTDSSSANSLTSAASFKPAATVQVTSSVTQSLTQPMDISRLCTSNNTPSQKYKVTEGNSNHTTTQQPISNFNSTSRTAEIQNQNIPSGYVADVTVPRPTYNSQTIDVDQPLGLGRNISSFSHLVDRYSSDERLIAGLQSSSTFYTDKGLGTSQLFNKPVSTNTASLPMFNQADMAAMQQCYNQSIQGSRSIYNRPIAGIQTAAPIQSDQKTSLQSQVQEKKKKRKSSKVVVSTSAETQQTNTPHQGFQSYAGLKGNASIEPSAISLKTSSVVPGSAFNFGPTPTSLGINPNLYSDKDAYPNFLEEFRSAPNYYMAAAAHHRSKPESSEKQTRTAHQSSNPQPTPGYSFLGASQPTRPSYPIGGPFITNPAQAAQLMDTSSPIYQHYLQAGVLNQGLLGPPGAYPPGYHPALSIRQPYDSRPPWL